MGQKFITQHKVQRAIVNRNRASVKAVRHFSRLKDFKIIIHLKMFQLVMMSNFCLLQVSTGVEKYNLA